MCDNVYTVKQGNSFKRKQTKRDTVARKMNFYESVEKKRLENNSG